METRSTNPYLTLDQKRAAEAAFQGLPFDPQWSEAAKAVYDEIARVMANRTPFDSPAPIPTGESIERGAPVDQADPDADSSRPSILSRDEAIRNGLLIDVTAIAQEVGLPVPVCISKSLWELGITASGVIPEEQHTARVKDVLLALQLRLAAARIAAPGIEFPALLAFPPEPAPQLLPLYALAQSDQGGAFTLTVLLASEVATIIRPAKN